jgi:hypothetical protein
MGLGSSLGRRRCGIEGSKRGKFCQDIAKQISPTPVSDANHKSSRRTAWSVQRPDENDFLEEVRTLKAACASHFAKYNFCRVHASLPVAPALA